jgi:hypothetical protein
MARFNYSEDEDYAGQFVLWRANMNRCLRGREGQKALRELRDALLALPDKRLISCSLAADGDVCAIDALLVARAPLEEREVLLKELQRISANDEDSAE